MELIKQIRQAEQQAREMVEQARADALQGAEKTRQRRTEALQKAQEARRRAIDAAVEQAGRDAQVEVERLRVESGQKITALKSRATGRAAKCVERVVRQITQGSGK